MHRVLRGGRGFAGFKDRSHLFRTTKGVPTSCMVRLLRRLSRWSTGGSEDAVGLEVLLITSPVWRITPGSAYHWRDGCRCCDCAAILGNAPQGLAIGLPRRMNVRKKSRIDTIEVAEL